MAILESINVGRIKPVGYASIGRTAIDKRPITGSVRAHALGLDGDQIADAKHHGGVDQAVYAYAAEDLEEWGRILGRELRPGEFGENLTTRGLDVNGALIGERWRVGEATFEVCSVRIPCATFAGFLEEDKWVRRFTEHGVPGAYLRVFEAGEISAGQEIEVVERPDHDVTVALMFRALTTDRTLLPRLLDAPRIEYEARRKAQAYVDAHR
ncbi:MOSC domain-containing protein YiiM [Mumia flava]|uniref:MOSC domain-containing protein YiiM n=1 Tax=Mumia flava TaxID=1348852 RepID=A0A0B2BAW3_9ACTN|nr:MOSC domain-containing protein [Mumia flava]PJJ53904.1 MOSC domain-containing protein YiiM [Mumia flava]